MKGLQHYQVCILQTISWLSKRAGKRYCYPSQAALVEILAASYQIKRCRRTLNYHLSSLEQLGYLRRIRRTHTGENGEIAFASTIYVLCKRGFNLLGRMFRILTQAGVAAWSRVKTIAHEDNWPRVQSLLSGIGRAVPPG